MHSVTAVVLVVVTVPLGACGRSGDSGAELPWEEPPPTTELPRSAEEAPPLAADVGETPTGWTVPDPLPADNFEAIDGAAERARRPAIPVPASGGAPDYAAWAPPAHVLTDSQPEAWVVGAFWMEAGRPLNEAWTQSEVTWPGGVESQWLSCPSGTAPSALLLSKTATADLTDFAFDYPSVQAPLGMRYHAARIRATTNDRAAELELHDPQFYVQDFSQGDTATVYVVDLADHHVPRDVEVTIEVYGCE